MPVPLLQIPQAPSQVYCRSLNDYWFNNGKYITSPSVLSPATALAVGLSGDSL